MNNNVASAIFRDNIKMGAYAQNSLINFFLGSYINNKIINQNTARVCENPLTETDGGKLQPLYPQNRSELGVKSLHCSLFPT